MNNEVDYDNLPPEVMAVVDRFDYDNDPYKECQLLDSRLRQIGWGADYGLDGEAVIFKLK